jgi:hypothetical protein
MDVEPFPLKYGATHDPTECTCRALKRLRLRRRRFDLIVERLKERQGAADFRMVEVEDGLYWQVGKACEDRQTLAGFETGEIRVPHFCFSSRDGASEESSPTGGQSQPSRISSHWSDAPGRFGCGGFMG